MEQTRRRIWTFAISVAAVLVIAAAAISGLFQLAVQALPGYHAEIESYVERVTGRPVRVGAVHLTWRYYYPALELHAVELLGDAGAPLLAAERLRLGFAPVRLLRGDFAPSRLELQGLALDARITADGGIEIPALASAADSGAGPLSLGALEIFNELRLLRCRLHVTDARRGELGAFGIVEAELRRGLFGTELEADVTLPAAFGERALLAAAFDGDWAAPAGWSGQWRADIFGIAAGPWLAPYLARGASLELRDTGLALRGELRDGRTRAVEARLRSGPVRARRAHHAAGFEALDAEARVEFADEDGAWQARLRQLTLESTHGRWPKVTGSLRYIAGAAGEQPVLEGELDFLRLEDLAPWLQIARAPGALLFLDQAQGEVDGLRFSVQRWDSDEPRYGLRGAFRRAALPAAGRAAGFAGASGEFAADESGGRAILQPGPLRLELPQALIEPRVELDAFEGELEWRRLPQAWSLAAPRFRWEALQTRGSGRLRLTLPDRPQASPELELAAQFSVDDVMPAKTLLPRAWGAGLRDWLDRAILSGRVTRGELAIDGRLDDFPFQEKPGLFRLDLEAAGIQLAFLPDWPPIEELGAKLAFRGNSLAVTATQGRIGGVPIASASANFPDFAAAGLTVLGTITGETASFYEYLRRTPLREDMAGLLDRTTARGPAAVDLRLDIPLHGDGATRARGTIGLQDLELRYHGFAEPIRDIAGVIRFGGARLSAENLEARVHGVPIAARIRPQADGSSLLTADFRLALDAAGKGLSELVPAWLRQKLTGAADFRAELVLGGGADDTPLKLQSDLAGIAVNLPAPLAKAAEAPVPLALTIGDAAGALRITADYQDRLAADLRYDRRAEAVALRRGTLRIGTGETPPLPDDGLVLGGTVAEADLQAWLQQLEGSGIEQQAPLFRRADVSIGRARWGPYSVRDTRYQWSSLKTGWELAVNGGNFGALRWDAPARQLTARMSQVIVEIADVSADAGAPEQAPAVARGPVDPAALPRLDLDVARLGLNQAELGHVQLVTERVDGGQRIRTLKAEGGVLNLSADGEWRRRHGRSSAALNLDLASGDIAALLGAAGYARTLDAKSAHIKGALRWPPAPQGIEWRRAAGELNLEFADGQLYTVDPGAGRVLGLFNFYALPRRLTLNFRDVLGQGLGFDRIAGDFRLADGNAHTDNLQIAGPSLRMDLRGRIGLAARDYDQQVTVYPDISAGVTVGALALGGPVAGVLALIAQELLNKPLDQVTQLSYRVTGSWDNPQVERAAEPSPPAATRSGSPSQRP